MRCFNKKIGGAGEDLAEAYLKKNGYRILERNKVTPYGEIDLIAMDGDTLVFVEVKARRSRLYSVPVSSITSVKQHKIINSALHYISVSGYECDGYRFDAVSIQFQKNNKQPDIELIKNAFDTSGL